MARNKTVYPAGRAKGSGNGTANLGFEQKLWLAAGKLRGNMDASEYKHVILGLIFLKYISSDAVHRRIPARRSRRTRWDTCGSSGLAGG